MNIQNGRLNNLKGVSNMAFYKWLLSNTYRDLVKIKNKINITKINITPEKEEMLSAIGFFVMLASIWSLTLAGFIIYKLSQIDYIITAIIEFTIICIICSLIYKHSKYRQEIIEIADAI